MKRLLSFCALLMLFALSMNAVPLSKSLYTGSCELHLGAPLGAGATIYGNGAVPASDYADLGAYSKLVIKTSGGGLRLLFNRVGNSGSNYLEISRDANQQYFSWDGVALTIDLDAIKANTGSARLNVIKNMYGLGDIIVNSMTLFTANEVAYEKTWDFTNWSTTNLSGGWSNNNDGSFTFQSYCVSNDGYLVNGGYGSSGTTNGYSSIIEETKGLKFACGRWDRNILYTTGTPGIAARTLEITVPNLIYGNVVKFYTDGNNTLTTDAGSITKEGTTFVFTVPNTITTYTDIKFTVGTGNTRMLISKIEVTKTPTNVYYNNVKFGSDNTSYQGSWRNGAHTIGVDLAIAGNTIRFEMRDGNGATLDMAALTEGNTANIANYFSFTSSDNSVIDASNATFEVSGNSVYVRNVSFLKWGEATVTLAYNGSNGFFDSSKSTVVTVTGNQRYIGFSGEATSVTEGYIDEADFRQFVRLYTNEARTGGAYYDMNVGFVATADTSKVISIGSTNAYNNRRFDIWTKPLSVGTATVHVVYPGDATQLPCEWDYDVTIKKHTAKLTYSSNAHTVDYVSDGTVINSGLPTLTQLMDVSDTNPNGTTPTYTVKYSSSDTNVATVDENTGAVTMHNSGITVITAYVVTTKTVNGVEVEAYTEAHAVYTLTVQGNQPQSGTVLVWLSHWDADQGAKGRKYYGSYWTQKNLKYFGDNTHERADGYGMFSYHNYGNQQLCTDSIGEVTYLQYGNSLIVSATAFTSMDWLETTYNHPRLDIHVPYKNFVYKLKNDTYVVNDEEGLRVRSQDGWAWTLSGIDSYIPAASKPVNGWTDPHDGKSYNKVWMTNINYSISDPSRLDTDSKGECINATSSDGQEWNKHYEIKPYPAMNADGTVSTNPGDSLVIYATIPGSGNVNPITISHKVMIVKGRYNLSTEPKSGYVTEGEWVIPYVNIPDIKLKDIKKVYIWIEDDDEATVECEYETTIVTDPNTNETHKAYVLYEKDVTNSVWLRTKHDRESGLDYADMIYPKITGLIPNDSTFVHIMVESPYYEDAECIYTLHVLPDSEQPAFHWLANDTGKRGKRKDLEVHSVRMGRDKGVNDDRIINYGEDDGIIKRIEIYEGDFIHMPGIVGTSNGNDEFSKAGNVEDRTNRVAQPEYGYKYLYALKQSEGESTPHVERNSNPYYWREGVPNYFFTTGYNVKGQTSGGVNLYEPSGNPLMPDNFQPSSQEAFIIKEIATGENFRMDTLMIYGNKAGTLYLWAQDPQTHLCCTPIEFVVKPKALIDSEKEDYMSGMTYPYTWDFEHMDLTDIKNEVENNGSAYWELIRVKQGGTPTRYQANGFFNSDHDDKDGNSSLRQRWFKNLNTKEGYMPQFYGLMLNIAGMDYWDQKYNRFNVSTNGDFIEFIGGPHFLQLPGFGVLSQNQNGAEERYNYQYYDSNKDSNGNEIGWVTKEGKDGTRKNDNKIWNGNLHNHVNTLNHSAASGYGYVSSSSNPHSQPTNVTTNDTYRNKKVRLVIVASGDDSNSQMHIGGKSMLWEAMDLNEIHWYQNISSGNKNNPNKYVCNTPDNDTGNLRCKHPGYCEYKLGKNRRTFVYELNPYDEEYQDHIYIMFTNNVKVYWMGISTEARDLRSDFDNFSYSYPKDIDLDKTNILMKQATLAGVQGKDSTSNNTWLSIKGRDMVGTEIGVDAYYASEYRRADESLTLTKVPNNRFAANEGVIVYPSMKISDGFNLNQDGMITVMRQNQTANQWNGEYRTETVNSKDENGNAIQVTYTYPVCVTTTIDKSFQYLPTYFIANAQNMADYDGTTTVAKQGNTEPYHKEATSNYAADYEGFGKVPMLNANEEPAAVADENGVMRNTQTNLLRPSVYTTFIRRDYLLQNGQEVDAPDASDSDPNYADGANDNRWVNLGMSNQFIWRNLLFSDVKTLRKSMIGTDGEFHDDDHYYMYGPNYVRFYRANQDQNTKNRRAYLSLTWEEYNVDTYGKGGVTYDRTDDYEGEIVYVPGATGLSGSSSQNSNYNISDRLLNPKSNPIRLVIGDENQDGPVVSDDAGIVDDINSAETVEGNEEYVFYNLNGVRVYRPSKGIYILNGKKVIVK